MLPVDAKADVSVALTRAALVRTLLLLVHKHVAVPREEAHVARLPAGACVSIRQHTSAFVSIRQHTSAYVSEEAHVARLPAGALVSVFVLLYW